MNSKLFIIGLILLTIIFVAGCIEDVQLKAVEGIDSISTDNYANTRLEYYYYIPAAVAENEQKSYPLLVMVPRLSGRGEHFVTQEFKQFANEENFIIVAPSYSFDKQNWESRQSYQYPSVWSGDALIDIIEKLEEKNNVTASKLFLFGHSAGAQFLLRFSILQGKLVDACAAHGSGEIVTPNEKVDVKFFITVGKQDTSRIEKTKIFYNIAQDYGIEVTYKEYEAGHSLTPDQTKDSLDFFKSLNPSSILFKLRPEQHRLLI